MVREEGVGSLARGLAPNTVSFLDLHKMSCADNLGSSHSDEREFLHLTFILHAESRRPLNLSLTTFSKTSSSHTLLYKMACLSTSSHRLLQEQSLRRSAHRQMS
jgi:hypothetical protein